LHYLAACGAVTLRKADYVAFGDLVRVEGSRDIIAGLLHFAGFEPVDFTDEEVGGGKYSVIGFATAGARADLLGLGATITTLTTQADLEAQEQVVAASISDDRTVGSA
jgi:hypothetical protein